MPRLRYPTALLALAAAASAIQVAAEETDAPTSPDTDSTNSAADPGPICTDRPTKSNGVCIVPEGRVQIESDLLFWSRIAIGTARSDVLAYTNPTIKYGLGRNTDVQINIAPLVEVRSRTSTGGITRQTGVGDLTLRAKQRLTGPDETVQIALLPFVKMPTAERGIGNREWEGGLLVPVQMPLGKATLTLVPQLNLLADAVAPAGRHLEFQGVANIAAPIAGRLSMAAELWTSHNWDPSGTVEQYSADAALIYLIDDDLQIDLGGNFGLNRATPDVQLYVGLSTRF